MSTPSPNPIADQERRSRRPWWAAFIAYTIALTAATHWPALDLSTHGAPAADKLLHLFAFALLGVFLWRTGWIPRLSLLLAILLLWVVFDEWSQSLAILQRQFSWQDVIASACGGLVAVAWIAALRPIGGEHNRRRLALQKRVLDDLFAHPLSSKGFAAWGLLALAIVPVAIALLLMLPPIIDSPYTQRPRIFLLTIATAAWTGVILYAWQALWRGEWSRAVDERRCPACAASTNDATYDERGYGNCPACGERLHRGTWLPHVSPDSARIRRMGRWPAALTIGVLFAGAATLYASIRIYEALIAGRSQYAGAAQSTARAINNLPDDFVVALDLTLLLMVGALALFLYRRQLARFHDRQDRFCRVCDHDLRATPIEQGIGRCGECGTQFARRKS